MSTEPHDRPQPGPLAQPFPRPGRLLEHAYWELSIATNGTPIVVPTGIRSFTVANLGLAGDGFVFADFTIAGVLGSTTVHRNIAVKTWSVSEDQDGLTGPFTITPAAGHFVDVTWVA